MAVSRLQNLNGDLTPIADHFNRTIVCTQAYYVQHYQDPKETSPFPDGCFIVVTDDTQSVMNGFVNQMYPVGSVYMNALVQTDPNVLFNFGNWTRITGEFLYAASASDTLLDTDGASTVTLTQDNLPATATFTIPALDLSIDSASTKHTHSGTTDANNRGHTHTIGDALAEPTGAFGTKDEQIQIFTAVKFGGTEQKFTHSHTCSDESQNHTHTFTTDEMSDDEATHTHTGKTTAASKTILDFGSGTAFSIIPPYVKLAIWYRAS